MEDFIEKDDLVIVGNRYEMCIRDSVNVVQTLVILYAVLGTLGVFLGDVLMMLLDPRIKLVGKGGTR